MSSITYNNVSITNVLTESIEHDIVMDDTGVDPLFVRCAVTVTGIVHSSGGGNTIGYQAFPNDPSTAWQNILKLLMQPRRNFNMTVGATTLFNVQPAATRLNVNNGLGNNRPDNAVDISGGPTTKVTLLQVIGTHTFKLRFRCEFGIALCDEVGSNEASSAGVVNFRFWIGQDINCTDWTSTITYNGRLRVSHGRVNVHNAVRSWQCIPPVQPGFRRKRIGISEAENSLSVSFTIVDEEKWAQAPYPATHMDGSYTVSSASVGGAIGNAELQLSLAGPKNVSKKSLHALASKILNSKLHLYDGQNEGRNFLLSASISESLSENRVDAFARIRLLGKSKEEYNLYNIVGDDLGTPLEVTQANGKAYDKEIAYTLKLNELSATTVGLFTSDLQDPCHVAKMPQATQPTPDGEEPPEPTGDTVIESETETPDTSEVDYSLEHFASAYSSYTLTSDIIQHKGKIAMPIGETSGSGEDTVKVVTLHSGACHREVCIVAERLNKWPNIPDESDFTDDNGIGHTCISYSPSPSAPMLSADGVKTLHRVDAKIVYALDRPPSSSESLPVGNIPYRSNGIQTDQKLMAQNFRLTPGGSGEQNPLPT